MTDPIEANLKYLADTLTTAWRGSSCLTCHLAELAALAQATLVFYQEQCRSSNESHWSAHWKRGLEDWK